jgi:hypothetical protein
MPGNGDLESSSFSESASPGALPLSPGLGNGMPMGTAVPVRYVSRRDSAACRTKFLFPIIIRHQKSGQEVPESGDDRFEMADRDDLPPPLGVKLTVYRMLNMMTLLSFGIIKGILTYMGKSTAPTTLEWVSGTLLAAV